MQVAFKDMLEDLSGQVQLRLTHVYALIFIVGRDACAPNCF